MQGGGEAKTAAAGERGDAWSPEVRPLPPPSAVEIAKPAGAWSATATLRAGGHSRTRCSALCRSAACPVPSQATELAGEGWAGLGARGRCMAPWCARLCARAVLGGKEVRKSCLPQDFLPRVSPSPSPPFFLTS